MAMANLALLSSSLHFPISTIFVFISFLTATQIQATHGGGEDQYDEFVKVASVGNQKPHKMVMREEKLSHFRFFWHDVLSGKTPTSITVVAPPKTPSPSFTGFGMVRMIDNPLTLGPQLSSKMVGRAQGFYASASQEEVGLLMTMNFAFVGGKYNESTITVLGRNPVLSAVREMPVIGGSGLFRFARGYALARTHTFDPPTGDAIVEYNVFVMHY